MANTHCVVNTTHCACWDIDAYNFVGIAATDIDNGTFVSLGAIKNTDGAIDEYVFTVTVDANGASDMKYIVDSPEVGTSLEQQLHDDPRYFYNEAGKPMSVKRIIPGDFIEIDINGFGSGKAPTDQASYTQAKIGADGKLEMVQQGGTFELVGHKTIGIGQTDVTVWVLKYIGA